MKLADSFEKKLIASNMSLSLSLKLATIIRQSAGGKLLVGILGF